jgi:hypothetical protein
MQEILGVISSTATTTKDLDGCKKSRDNIYTRVNYTRKGCILKFSSFIQQKSMENSRGSVPQFQKGISALENKDGGLGLRRINQSNLKIRKHLLMD